MPASNLIRFKRGTSAQLATIKSGKTGIDGAFYLTIDDADASSRLYVGRANGDVVPVNQGIYTVTAVTDLTSSVNSGKLQPGDFAYVTGTAAQNYTDGNILAYWTGDKWLQLNKVDVTDKFLSSLDVAITTTGGVATVKLTGLDEGGTTLNGALETTFTMQGANGVTVSNTDDAITVTGTSYGLSSAAIAADSHQGVISLTGNDGTNNAAAGSVTIKSADSNHVHITGAANNIEIDTPVVQTATLSNETNGFGLQVTDSFSNSTIKSTIDPTIKYGGTGSSTAHFVSGEATLNVYNKDEIDGLLKGLDALTYKGTVGTSGSYAQSVSGITASSMPALHIGDTFKLVGDHSRSYENIPINTGTPQSPTVSATGTAHGGDLLIANGVETDGEITTLYYDIVEVEQGEDTTYTITASDADKKITVADSHGDTIGGMAIAATANNPITISGASDSSHVETVTIGHGVVNQASSLTNGKLNATTETAAADVNTITAVTDVTVDEFGHTTAFKTKEFGIAKLAAVSESFSTSATGNVATITNTPTATNSDSSAVTATAGSFDLASENLTVTAPTVAAGENPQVMVNFVWESF